MHVNVERIEGLPASDFGPGKSIAFPVFLQGGKTVIVHTNSGLYQLNFKED